MLKIKYVELNEKGEVTQLYGTFSKKKLISSAISGEQIEKGVTSSETHHTLPSQSFLKEAQNGIETTNNGIN